MNGVYFYGGAFDPLTLAHEAIIRHLCELNITLEIGVTNHEYKSPPMFSAYMREAMVREYIHDLYGKSSGLHASCFIYAQRCRTWEYMQGMHPSSSLTDTIVVGMDEMRDLMAGKWHHSQELMDNYAFLVLPRTEQDMSSTQVRQLIKDRASDEELLKYVSPNVLREIRDCEHWERIDEEIPK